MPIGGASIVISIHWRVRAFTLWHHGLFHYEFHHISHMYDSLPEVFLFIWNTFMIFCMCHAWWMSLCNLRWMKLLPPRRIRTWLHKLTFSSCEFQPCEHQKQNLQTIKSSKPVLWYQLDLKMKKNWKTWIIIASEMLCV